MSLGARSLRHPVSVLRMATIGDAPFLCKMLYEAAVPPNTPRPPLEEVLWPDPLRSVHP